MSSGPPTVSVVVPCLNEERTIGPLLEALRAQTYATDRMEVVIADGGSTDRTGDAIDDFRLRYPDLSIAVVANPRRNIPAGLNRAVSASRGEFVVRMDAHAVPAPDYVARCVSLLEQGRGDNVGGVWDIQPSGPSSTARAIAASAGHRLGAGDARYRVGGPAGPVDTVPFGAFRRELLQRIGPFAEDLPFDEDSDMNARIRRAGGVVWLDPTIRSTYFARATLGSLARQYWRYGYWKRRALDANPGTMQWRQAVPAVFVASLAVLAFAALRLPAARRLLALQGGVYTVALGTAAVREAKRRSDVALVTRMPAALATMHMTYGLGFISSNLTRIVDRRSARPDGSITDTEDPS